MNKYINIIRNKMITLQNPVINDLIERKLTYLTPKDLLELKDTVEGIENNKIPGKFIEAGVALGGSAIFISLTKDQSRPFELYDVYDMIPAPSERDDKDVHDRYEVIASKKSKGIGGDEYYGYKENLIDVVKSNFIDMNCTPEENNVSFHKGLFEETMNFQSDDKIALAHIDCDWYDSVYVCLEKIWPILSSGGVLIIDDYYVYSGARKAIDEFFKDKSGFEFVEKSKFHIYKK